MINQNISKLAISLGSPVFVLSLLATCLLFFIMVPTAYSDPPCPTTLKENPVTFSDDKQSEAFTAAIHGMALTLFSHIGDPDPETGDLADGIAVSSFVDLKKLTRTSSFGRYLAEQLMTEFQQRGYQVIEIRKSTSILIQEKRGEYGLSRDLAEIKQRVATRTLITGTYTLAGDHILVNAKVIDNKNAALLSSATMVLPRNQLTDLLLADSASAYPRKQEISSTSLKRLELVSHE